MRVCLFAAAASLVAVAEAQPGDEAAAAGTSASPLPITIEPIYEGGIRRNRGITMPPNLSLAPERRLSFGYTASNSYLNPDLLVCFDRSCEIEYETDHTGNLLHVGYRQPLLQAFEFGVTASSYRMDDIPGVSPLHRLADDDFLEFFHREILREDSLPTLSNAPEGRQLFRMEDLAGRRLTLEPERSYALPLRLHLTRYFDIRQTARTRIGLNAAVHLAIPLEGDVDPVAGRTALSRGVDAGVAVNFIRVRRLTANVSSTMHVQYGRFRSDVHVVNPNSPVPGDDDFRSQYALTYGLRFNGTFRGRAACSFGIAQLSTSAQYDQEFYWAWDPTVFDGGNNLRGAILGANDYGSVSFGCEFKRRRYQVTVVEDIAGLSDILIDDGAGTSYDTDLAIGLTASWAIGSRPQ